MKRNLLILFSVLFLILIGFILRVSFMDWNEHKSKIASSLSELTGKQVVFNGNLSFSLFPSPQLTVSDVELYNLSGNYAEVPLAKIKKLSARVSYSALFGGNFDISRVSLSEPEINLEFSSDGTLNWVSQNKKFQEDDLRQMQISLDSVTLENATLHFIYPQMKIDSVLSNLNAEIIAETVFGPYRIEGSYTKGDNPEGFAVSIGQIAENIATSVNLAVNFPTTKSYARFDGTVYFRDRKILGNIIAESETPVDFVKDMFQLSLDQTLNQKFALTAAVDSGLEKISLSNVVIKYGKTSGAGTVLIPLPTENRTDYHPKVELAFNMTDFDLDVPVLFAQNFYRDKKGFPKLPDGFDLIGDVKSLKSYYNGQTIKDLALSFDLNQGKFSLRNMSGKAFDNTSFVLNGNFELVDSLPKFKAFASFSSGEFSRLLEWFSLKPNIVAPATYQKASGQASLSGEGYKIYVSPLSLTLDNMVFSGEAGLVWENGLDSMWVLNADNINFDNYVSPWAEGDVSKSWAQKFALLFKNSEWLKGKKFNLVFNLDKGIFKSIPFEGLQANLQVRDDKISFNRFELNNILDSSVVFSGVVSGLGNEPSFDSIQYNLAVKDFGNFSQKLSLFPESDFNFGQASLVSKGVLSGNLKYLALKTENSFNKNTFNYSGVVDFSSSSSSFDGKIDFQSSDFVKMLSEFGIQYSPQAFSLGLFNVQADLKGMFDNFAADNVVLNIGANRFTGKVQYNATSGRKKFVVEGNINRFETNRFLPEDKSKSQLAFQDKNKLVNFLSKPTWSKKNFDFEALAQIDVKANVKIDEFFLQNIKFPATEVEFLLASGNLNVRKFLSKYADGKLSLKGNLLLGVKPEVSFDFAAENLLLSDLNLGGKVFGFKNGRLTLALKGKSSLTSEYDFWDNLKAGGAFEVNQPEIVGWNFEVLEKDLLQRTNTDGLKNMLLENLQSGISFFDNLKGNVQFEKNFYLIEKLEFTSPFADISAHGEGNVEEWNVNGVFDVTLKNKPSKFSFEWQGSLEDPQVDVDVSSLVSEFQEQKAKVEAEHKAKEMSEQKKLENRYQAQLAQTQKLKDEYTRFLIPQYETIFEVLEDDNVKKSFEDLKTRIDASVKILDEVATLTLSPQISEKLIDSVAEKNEKAEADLADYYREMNTSHLSETQDRLKIYQQKLEETYKDIMTFFSDGKNRFSDFQKRLDVISSPLDLTQNEELRSFRDELDGQQKNLEQLHERSQQAVHLVNKQNDVDLLERVVRILKNNLSQMQEQKENIVALSDELFNKGEEIVLLEEQHVAQQREEEARRKKIEESTGMIADADGNVKTIVPNLDDESKDERDGVSEVIKVLDFSDDDDAPSSSSSRVRGKVMRD